MRDNNTIFTAATALFKEKVFPRCRTSKDNRGDVPVWNDKFGFPEFNTPPRDTDHDDDDPCGSKPPSKEEDNGDGGYDSPSLEDLKCQHQEHMKCLQSDPSLQDKLNKEIVLLTSPKPRMVLLPQTPAPSRHFVDLPPPGSPPLSPTPCPQRQQ